MADITRVAIAIQGGGSHAAFAAGLLRALLAPGQHARFELLALSGTSGGALCAALAWSGLLDGGAEEARRRLAAFWHDLGARLPLDVFANFWSVALARLPVTEEISPYAYQPAAEPALRALLLRHARLETLPDPLPALPRLLVGATDVLTGDRTVFEAAAVTYDALIASAAIPPLYRAVRIGGHLYWDGLFTTNPPIRELMASKPDELWVVQINPQRRDAEPQTTGEIDDRRNELSGNLSLGQELFFIQKINELLATHPSLADTYRPVTIRMVELDVPGLDAPSKFDRNPALIERLMQAGAERAAWFFDDRSLWPRDGTVPRAAVRHDGPAP